MLRGLLTGELAFDMLAQDDCKAVADLCVNCHQCRLECPAGVDIPRMFVYSAWPLMRRPTTEQLDELAASGIEWVNAKVSNWSPEMVAYAGSIGLKTSGWALHLPMVTDSASGANQLAVDLKLDAFMTDDDEDLQRL